MRKMEKERRKRYIKENVGMKRKEKKNKKKMKTQCSAGIDWREIRYKTVSLPLFLNNLCNIQRARLRERERERERESGNDRKIEID